ncbi:hypothetical protein TWF132_001021 [Orbilia oligospora]|nr:hypothetical protein TWF132_001021 [Orbilia oligospora]
MASSFYTYCVDNVKDILVSLLQVLRRIEDRKKPSRMNGERYVAVEAKGQVQPWPRKHLRNTVLVVRRPVSQIHADFRRLLYLHIDFLQKFRSIRAYESRSSYISSHSPGLL